MNIELSKIVIVAGDAELAEQVCSRLRTPGVYLPVIEAPMVRLVEYGVFDQDCVRVANAIRNLDAQLFLCLKVPPEVMTKLRNCMPNLSLIALEKYDEAQLAKLVQLRRVSQKYQDLILTDAARCIEDMFIVEGEFDLATVIAANLAVAHGGRIAFINSASDNDVDFVREKSHSWSNGSFEERQGAKDAVIGFLQSRLPTGLLASRTIKSVSFCHKRAAVWNPSILMPNHSFLFVPATWLECFGWNALAGMLWLECFGWNA